MEEEKRIVINTCKSLQPGSHQQTVPTHSEAIVIGGGRGIIHGFYLLGLIGHFRLIDSGM